MNTSTSDRAWLELEKEMRDLAFLMDRRGNPTAADVAMQVASRIRELLAPEQVPENP